ncbi:hypothetical protein O2K51_12010 [Apibacter raozihei]|uniref:hypothetical protein n=1 Tax=Apibacter raozihei TaxID=2500547 RepID=UPI000FE34F48|nr:hypothetical protein [Apibacter raozihei]
MDTKTKINTLLLVLLLLCCKSCWGVDEKMKEEALVQDFKIINLNQNEYDLVLKEGDGVYTYIDRQCQELFFDSLNLYVKSRSTDSLSKYSHIKLFQDRNHKYIRNKIEQKEYYLRKKECNNCLIKQWENLPLAN